jgi:hypothetical protein
MAAWRYVILRHDHPTPHFDLMLEQGDTLRTWRLPEPPLAEKSLPAEALGAHRLAYLDYEGPVSGNRGTVIRWDRGTFKGDPLAESILSVVCQGEKLQGTLRLEHHQADQWELRYFPHTEETR